MSEMVMHKVTINLNMFCALMKYIIVNNLDSTLIITADDCGSKMSDTHLLKQQSKQKKFPICISKGAILEFCAGSSDN
jgi:hypothetical protein